MPWIVVTGRRTWRPKRGMTFGPGKHEVTADVADIARTAGAGIWVGAEEPVVARRVIEGSEPLTLEDVKVGTRPGVYMPDAERVESLEPPPIAATGRAQWPCPWCPNVYPNRPRLDRHLDRAHEPDAVSS